ncbi:MAG TPA: glycoside hydrolase family 95 protein [Mobilitalea sp.]|nr:glycoside hydrolase family 95 protein [Mobilitalea sp.]
MKLYYTKPATQWEETLPIGNGNLGAMIWGGSTLEQLGLNEDSLWSGYYHDKNNPNAFRYLEKARELIQNGNYPMAEELIREHMLGEYNESYLPLGNLLFHFQHSAEITDYERILDIDHSIAAITYTADGNRYNREYFASYPSKDIFIKFTCDKPIMNLSVAFESQFKNETIFTRDNIKIMGKCPEHVDPNYINSLNPVIQGEKGIEYDAELKVLFSDGSVTANNESLQISNASTVIFAFHAVKASDFDAAMDYDQIKAMHMKDYKAIYDKVDLYLGEQIDIPTDERLERLRQGEKDNGLFALYFQYGRYLLISSSREGSLPANLQGIWSWDFRAPWSSNWTTNINTQMNYWLAQSCNLKECMPPYFDFLKKICKEGKKTAKSHYNCRGFVHHHNADYWCSTNPVGLAYGQEKGEGICVTWSFWPMGGAWLTSELFKHYEYNPDNNFLKGTVYPILREAALFLIDWTYEHDGYYITCPSTSPENRFRMKDGSTSCIAMSSAMDLALVREVFISFKKTCALLALEDEILEDIEKRLMLLTPFTIGSKGQMLEWHEEFEEVEPGHRHISHLYSLFPSELFAGNHDLAEACRISLTERLKNGGGYTGWSCAWIINVFAILEDRDNAYKYLKSLLTHATHKNLWGDHPPFQIDANFGGTAGIANMLVQDRNGEVKILPALPKEFDSGYVKGLRIKNGKSVDIKWSNGKLESYNIY